MRGYHLQLVSKKGFFFPKEFVPFPFPISSSSHGTRSFGIMVNKIAFAFYKNVKGDQVFQAVSHKFAVYIHMF